jgi:PilZ domain
MNAMKSWFGRLSPPDRRNANRRRSPQLVAYYWDGAVPVAHHIRDISSTGLYLHTDARWYPGTLVMMTLQRTDKSSYARSERSIAVQSKVIRWGPDGVGLEFIFPEPGESCRPDQADREGFVRFAWRFLGTRGQARVDCVLLLPFALLLVRNLVNFGGFFFAAIILVSAGWSLILGPLPGPRPARCRKQPSPVVPDPESQQYFIAPQSDDHDRAWW